MWFYRRILCIPWTALQTNKTDLQKMGQERKLVCCIKQRQLKFPGHVIGKGKLEDVALSRRIPGSAQGVPSVSHLLATLNIVPKSWTIMGCCPKQNKLEKHHSTSTAGTAMLSKERVCLVLWT